MKNMIIGLRFLVLVPCLLATMIACTGKPLETRPADGSLRPCPDRPNCVSSEDAGRASAIQPLTFQGPPPAAWQRLKEVIREMGGEIREEQTLYLRAAFTSRVFRFVDDVEIRMVPAENVMHVRSAARLGYSDLGVNRKRVEKLRQLFNRKMGTANGQI